jgi:hypothetical protein
MKMSLVLMVLIANSGMVNSAENHPRSRYSLERMLEERDLLIASLLKRVDALEKKGEGVGPVVLTEPMPAKPDPGTMTTTKTAPESTKPTEKKSVIAARKSAASAARTQTAKLDGGAPEEDEAQRALERTLVISGALLVPYGQAEVQPGFTYLRYSGQGSTLLQQTGGVSIAAQSYHTDTYLGSAYLRFGLPWESQFEAYVPYESINRTDTTILGSQISSSAGRGTNGFGDIRLGFAKTLLTEKEWWPDIIARIAWSADTGRMPYLIPLGSGYNQLIGSVTVTKRQDPLVFFGTASYQAAFTQNNRSPGDILGFTIGTILGASPDTSLRFFLNQNFLSNAQYFGKNLPGTSANISTLNIGASTVLGKGFFLDFTSGMGLTTTSPDYVVGLSFAYRFDVPMLPSL